MLIQAEQLQNLIGRNSLRLNGISGGVRLHTKAFAVVEYLRYSKSSQLRPCRAKAEGFTFLQK
jgi:hypothetical protein